MSISRRKFIRTGTMLGLAAAALPLQNNLAFGQKASPASPVKPGVAPADADPLSHLTQNDFEKCLFTTFGIRSSSTLTKVELYEARANKPGIAQGLDNFSLFFRGTHTSQLGQGTYRFEHPQLGTFSLFIGPAGVSGKMKLYQAVFNRLQVERRYR